MGRPPSTGGPVFRFTHAEVAEMEACLQQFSNSLPAREIISSLAEKFSASQERAGKIVVQPKQVWNWFQNRRYSQRSRVVKAPAKIPLSPAPREDPSSYKNVTNSVSAAPGKTPPDAMQLEFEAKSARDGAWYDVNTFLSLRKLETGDPEVRVRFAGFGMEEDEWVNVRKYVRQRSLPCEPSECAVVLPGDLILCFQEGKDQALYFDAHVLDAQRRRHDVRGCRCRFLVRYDHDQSEEIVPLKKICRRPETDYRMQILVASKAIVPPADVTTNNDSSATGGSTDLNTAAQKPRKARKLMDVNTDEPSPMKEPELEAAAPSAEGNSSAIPDASTVDATLASASCEKPQQ